MATNYENVPVFLSNMPYDDSASIIAKAQVTVDEESNETVITIKNVGTRLTEFILLGRLSSFELSASVLSADPDKAKEYWSRHRQ